MTNQEMKQKLFDNGYIGLHNQQQWSISGHTCAYRGNNNARCWIGWSIPDEKYNKNLEGENAAHPRVLKMIDIGGKIEGEEMDQFIFDMQLHCHDRPSGEGMNEFTLNPAKKFAKQHGLTIPDVENENKP